MNTFPLLSKLRDNSDVVLLAGAGGGFDIFAAIPLLFHLRELGKEVVLANLSFTPIELIEGPRLTPVLLEVNSETGFDCDYFPEKFLCEWLNRELGCQNQIFCIERTGAAPIVDAYQALVAECDIDTVVLVDGGTDSLMRGDEVGLGTPQEDIASIAAVSELELEQRYLVCIGFGVDTFHGVNHFQFLEAVADLTKRNAFLGGGPLLNGCKEAEYYREALEYVESRMPDYPSIVNNSVLSSVAGEYGDFHATHRTEGSQLWINPLMSFYWAFDLPAVANRCLYLDQIKDTKSYYQLSLQIEAFRAGLDKIRGWDEIPA